MDAIFSFTINNKSSTIAKLDKDQKDTTTVDTFSQRKAYVDLLEQWCCYQKQQLLLEEAEFATKKLSVRSSSPATKILSNNETKSSAVRNTCCTDVKEKDKNRIQRQLKNDFMRQSIAFLDTNKTKINVVETLKAWKILHEDGLTLISPENWCRYCGARVTSNFRLATNMVPPMRLCQAHASRNTRWHKSGGKSGLDLSSYHGTVIQSPIKLEENTELHFITSKAYPTLKHWGSHSKRSNSKTKTSASYEATFPRPSTPSSLKRKRDPLLITTPTLPPTNPPRTNLNTDTITVVEPPSKRIKC
jgi:hypothetical protein